jgi:hypothetical protein
MSDRPQSELDRASQGGLWGTVRRHPVISGTLLGCTLVGAVLGFYLLSGEWSALRRVAAGAVAGGASAFVVTATKMFD